jgi:hypothetical protein
MYSHFSPFFIHRSHGFEGGSSAVKHCSNKWIRVQFNIECRIPYPNFAPATVCASDDNPSSGQEERRGKFCGVGHVKKRLHYSYIY